jgi:hypothetical protein
MFLTFAKHIVNTAGMTMTWIIIYIYNAASLEEKINQATALEEMLELILKFCWYIRMGWYGCTDGAVQPAK